MITCKGEENHLRCVIDVNTIQSTSNHHKVNHNSSTVGHRVEANQTRKPKRNTGVSKESEQSVVIIGYSILLSTSARRNSLKEKCINLHILSLENSIRYINDELGTINIHSTPSHVNSKIKISAITMRQDWNQRNETRRNMM